MSNEKILSEDTQLPKERWLEFSIGHEHFALFESFCSRNKIPFEETVRDDEGVLCRVRDGIDAQDVCSYMLRQAGEPEDKEYIYMLRNLRIFFAPTYEYEFSIYRTEEDEKLLESFDYDLIGNENNL